VSLMDINWREILLDSFTKLESLLTHELTTFAGHLLPAAIPSLKLGELRKCNLSNHCHYLDFQWAVKHSHPANSQGRVQGRRASFNPNGFQALSPRRVFICMSEPIRV
jgi:hypothetical protein